MCGTSKDPINGALIPQLEAWSCSNHHNTQLKQPTTPLPCLCSTRGGLDERIRQTLPICMWLVQTYKIMVLVMYKLDIRLFHIDLKHTGTSGAT